MASQSRREALRGTPEIKYGAECCSICLQEFVRGDICRVLPRCGHMHHKSCIDQWLLNRSLNCPVCRQQAVAEEKPREARKPLFDRMIYLEWMLFGAAATSLVIVYGRLAYSFYELCDTIAKFAKLCSKGDINLKIENLKFENLKIEISKDSS